MHPLPGRGIGSMSLDSDETLTLIRWHEASWYTESVDRLTSGVTGLIMINPLRDDLATPSASTARYQGTEGLVPVRSFLGKITQLFFLRVAQLDRALATVESSVTRYSFSFRIKDA